MRNGGRNTHTSYESRSSITSIPVITGPLIDTGLGTRVGTSCYCMNRVLAANTDTALPHSLGRLPNGYKMVRSSSGGVLYDPSTGTTAWSATNVTLRATVAGTYSFELI